MDRAECGLTPHHQQKYFILWKSFLPKGASQSSVHYLYLSTFEVWPDGLTNWVINGCKSLSCFSQLKIIPMQCCCFFPVQYSEGQNTIGFRRDGLILGSQPALCVILSYRTSMSSLSDMEDIKTNSGSLTRRKSRGWQGAIKKMLKSCWIQTLV